MCWVWGQNNLPCMYLCRALIIHGNMLLQLSCVENIIRERYNFFDFCIIIIIITIIVVVETKVRDTGAVYYFRNSYDKNFAYFACENARVCLQESWGSWICCRREFCTSALSSLSSARSRRWAALRELATCRRILNVSARLCAPSDSGLIMTEPVPGWTSISSASVPISRIRSFRHESDFFCRTLWICVHATGSHAKYSLPRGRRKLFSR